MHLMEQRGRSLLVFAGKSEKPESSLLAEAAAMFEAGGSVRLLDANLVFGIDHIRSAFEKASRAFDNDQNVSDSLATETMLYMSGCRQIQEAVELFRLKGEGRAVVCLADTAQNSRERLKSGLSITEDEAVLTDFSKKDVHSFGIGIAEAGTVPDDKVADLVLERVAGVDTKRK